MDILGHRNPIRTWTSRPSGLARWNRRGLSSASHSAFPRGCAPPVAVSTFSGVRGVTAFARLRELPATERSSNGRGQGNQVQIEQIDIKNYRLFKDVTISGMQPLVVVIGANGTGKSTLFDVFSFVQDAVTYSVAFAVARRGGFRDLVSRGQDGPIKITIKFRGRGGRMATYMLSVGLDESQRTVVEREVLRYRRGPYGKAWHFVDFRRGSGHAITNGAAYDREGVQPEWEEYTITNTEVLAITVLGQLEKFHVVAELRHLIENWHISDFSMSDARSGVEAGFAERDSKPPPLVAVEGPENHLYPDLLRELAEEFRLCAGNGSQLFISTHSPGFLDCVELDEVYWLVKDEGFAVAHAASKSQLLRNLIKHGDTPGALWKQGLLGKRAPL